MLNWFQHLIIPLNRFRLVLRLRSAATRNKKKPPKKSGFLNFYMLVFRRFRDLKNGKLLQWQHSHRYQNREPHFHRYLRHTIYG